MPTLNVDLRACIAGRKDAWDHFVRATAPVIYAAVRRAMQHRGLGRPGKSLEIDDRVQDVYVRLLREDCHLLRVFDPAKASLPTWLTLIARTVVHEQTRKRGPLIPSLSLNGTEKAAAGGAGIAADQVGASDIDLPIAILSQQQRSVIVMLFQEGLSVEQAAARLGVEAQTIRSAKHKALSRLREHLQGAMNQPEATTGTKAENKADLRGYSDRQTPITKESEADVAPSPHTPRPKKR